MAGERAEDPADVLGIPGHAIGPCEIHPPSLVEVAAQDDLGLVGLALDQRRPATDGNLLDEVPDAEPGLRGPDLGSVEERGERDVTGGVAGLRK